MKIKTFILPLLFVLWLPFLLSATSPRFAAAALPPITPPTSSAMFIENVGQFAERARFQVQGSPGTLWLADDALWLTLLAPATDPPADASADLFPHNQFPYNTAGAEPSLGVHIKLSFVGANAAPELEPFDRRQTSVNYFTGNNPDQWHTDVPVWAGVRYAELYPGLDLEIGGEGGQLRPRLICHQNCSSALQQVRLQIEGAESLHLTEDHLILTNATGNFVLPSLTFAITESNTTIPLNLIPHLENNTLSFHISSAHSPQPASPPASDNLMDLLYGTFLGGGDDDASFHSAVDGLGNTYTVGYTRSTDFPTTPGTFDPTLNGLSDVYVLKLNPTGTDLVYASYLGGDSNEDGYGLAVDDAGHAYVTGWTESANFPTTPGAFDTTIDLYRDAFIVQLNPAGNSLFYATFLGGDEFDEGRGIVVDTGGNAYVTGYTFSSDFPATPGAFDTTPNGNTDIFVAKLNPAGSDLIYATYVGGETNEFTVSIATDETGNAYVAGSTASSNFPTTPGAFDTTYNGGEYDGFVFKLNPTASDLLYATVLGGSGSDGGGRMAVDAAGHVYITGQTNSANFPTTPGAFDTTPNGGEEGFVVKFNPTGSGLIYGTFLGGSGNDTVWAIAVNELGNAYITGYTSSASFPTTPGAFDPTLNGYSDSFFVNLNPAGSDLDYATFLGGNGVDVGYGISVDALGQVYISGYTGSVNFPTTPDAFDPTYNGGNGDSFIVKLAVVYIPAQASFSGSPTSGIAPLNVTFTNLSTGDFDTCAWDFGDGSLSNNCNDPTHLFTAAGVYTVSLTVSGLGGTDTLTQSNYMTVYEPVVANFNGTPTRGTAPLNVIFTNLSAGDFYTCLWDFGDGATSTACVSPVRIYEALGTYTVALTVNGPGGTATETKTEYIIVEPNLLFLPLLRSADE